MTEVDAPDDRVVQRRGAGHPELRIETREGSFVGRYGVPTNRAVAGHIAVEVDGSEHWSLRGKRSRHGKGRGEQK